jgi:GNAT superfamily N-acetyltransferase
VGGVADDLTWRGRVAIEASPGAMARLLHELSLLDVRVVTLFTASADELFQLVDLVLKAPIDVDRSAIANALSAIGADVIVIRGADDDAGDIATRVLQLSARVAADPDGAPKAAADLVLADSWEVTRAAEGADASAMVLRLQWTLERHVILRRLRAPFTRTEQNRASAFLELISALSEARGDVDGFGWRETLAGGGTVTVRLGRPEDAEGVERMHERSSIESRYQRYFTPMNEWREDNLRRITGGHRGATLVVTDVNEVLIALGNVFPTGPDDSDGAEIALIVDERWQGQGVGSLLISHLIEVARRLGFTRLMAYVLAENRTMLHVLEATDLEWTVTSDHDLGAAALCLITDLTPVPQERP